MNDKERFADMIRHSQRIVAFTGAGISTESGIPDFRSAGGMFDRLSGRHFSGEETLSIGFLETYPKLFFRNYAEHFDFSQALPNAGHRFFAALEQTGKEITVVTQNIDNLHQSAGSSDVIELHGKRDEMADVRNGRTRRHLPKSGWTQRGIQRDSQGRMVRPDIVLYGEMLNEEAMERAAAAISAADMLIVIGTSLARLPGRELCPLFQRPLRRPAEPDARAAVAVLPVGRPDRCGRLFGGSLARIFWKMSKNAPLMEMVFRERGESLCRS